MEQPMRIEFIDSSDGEIYEELDNAVNDFIKASDDFIKKLTEKLNDEQKSTEAETALTYDPATKLCPKCGSKTTQPIRTIYCTNSDCEWKMDP